MILDEVQQFASPTEALAHISEESWSNYTKADYSIEQWHAACLIHLHDEEATSKSQCKLPVKTPNGVLNRNGVHAATAALAGARGGLKGVSDEQKNKAAAALRRYYSQLDENPPESLAVHGVIDFREKPGSPEDILEHFGVKGMRWGVRKAFTPTLDTNRSTLKKDLAKGALLPVVGAPAQIRLAKRVIGKQTPMAKTDTTWQKRMFSTKVSREGYVIDPVPRVDKEVKRASKKELKTAVKEINNKPEYVSAKKRGELKDDTLAITKKYDKEQFDAFSSIMKKNLAQHPEVYNPSGTKKMVFHKTKNEWWIGTEEVKHVDEKLFRVRVIRDDSGVIIDYEFMEDAMAQTADLGVEFLEHFGVKGMRWGIRKDISDLDLRGVVKEPIVRKTKNGDTFTLTPKPTGAIPRQLAKVSRGFAEKTSNSSHLKITDKDGKKIGDASFWFKGKDDIYLNWIQVKGSARGQGYASAVLQAAAEHGKTTGRKRMVLEVPGNAPDARHIYEKMGFKPTGVVQGHPKDVWGGLTQYEYRFDDKEG